MGMTDHEKTVLLELLSGVNSADLILIAKTVGQKLIDVNTSQRAIDIILLHSESLESVLHRKKISKQLLFNYLHYKQVPVQPHLSKEEIIVSLVKFWKSKSNDVSNNQFSVQNSYQSLSSSSSVINNQEFASTSQQQNQNYLNQQQNEMYNCNNTQLENTSSILLNQFIQNNETCNTISNTTTNQFLEKIDVNALGKEFTKWFYNKLNDCNINNNHYFDLNMFFENVEADFKIIKNINETDNMEEENHNVINNNNVTNGFIELQRKFNLYFNLNLNSMITKNNSYGNIVIGICGSLHCNSAIIGIFEQFFQLFNDPLCNSMNNEPVWKIQKTSLTLKFTNNIQLPIENNNINTILQLCE